MSSLNDDCHIFAYNLWEDVDLNEFDELTSTEFWNQVEYETNNMEFSSEPELSTTHRDDSDWMIPDELPFEVLTETPEDQRIENIMHHDCMWTGLCEDDIVHPTNTFVPADMISASPGQSLLRRDMPLSRPDTPPSLDGDEHPQFRHSVDVAGTAQRLLRDSAAVAADHSYTLSRQNTDNLGLQTPSDTCESEEEIDVVSLGTTSDGPLVSTTPLRANYSQSTAIPGRHHLQRATATVMSRPPARKRLIPPVSLPSASVPRRRGPGRRGRSTTDTDSEVETSENDRRFQHNDMERLRRVELKLCFDILKNEIPATRDKDRAPKVVILKEAAALCRKLQKDDLEKEYLGKQQHKLQAKLKKLRFKLSRLRVY